MMNSIWYNSDWNGQMEDFTWATDDDRRKVQKRFETDASNLFTFFRCSDYVEMIPWKNNVNFPNDCTIASAIEYGKRDEDNGWVGLIILMPKDDTCSAWLDYLGYLAFMHERYNLGVNH